MGGNVIVLDASGKKHSAGKADFRKIDREEFVNSFLQLFKRLDVLFEKETGRSLWPMGRFQSLASSGAVFSGSSSHLFNRGIDDEEFVHHKPVVGDIDITIPKENLESLYGMFEGMKGTLVTPEIKLVGQKPSVSQGQINAIFAYTFDPNASSLKIQVDFEGAAYEKGGPSEFVKFARSSDWADVKNNVKGVFHKYLLRSISTVLTLQTDVVLLTPTSPLSPPEKIKVSKTTDPVHLLSFSVDRGLRTSAQQQFLPDGQPLFVGGKRAFKKIEPADSKYHQSKSDIFTLIFGSEPVGNELTLFGSFSGMLQLMQDHLNDQQVSDIYLDFIGDKLYGKRGQPLDAYDPKNDVQAKSPAVEAFKRKFPFLASHDERLNLLVDDYYKNYKIAVAESIKRMNKRMND